MTSSSTSSQLQAIDPTTLKQWHDQGRITLVDVREPGEFAGEHIQRATLVSLAQVSPERLPADSSQVVLYCQTGNRSGQAAQKLLAAGVPSLMHLSGGLNAWKQQGLPTKINKNAPISLMRQVQITAGSLVFIGTVLGAAVSPWFLLLSGFVGAGLVFAGVSNTCMMARMLAKLPYNQRTV